MNNIHKECPCGKSSDAYVEYPNGGYCYSCFKKFWKDKEPEIISSTAFTLQQFSIRGIPVQALKKYDVKIKVSDATGDWISVDYPYKNNATKSRTQDKKFIWTEYSGPGLFGTERFEAGSAQVITITEGEDDAMASYTMNGFKYPVVSVKVQDKQLKIVSLVKTT